MGFEPYSRDTGRHFGLGGLALVVVVGLCVIAFGLVTEHQKDHLKRWLVQWLAPARALAVYRQR